MINNDYCADPMLGYGDYMPNHPKRCKDCAGEYTCPGSNATHTTPQQREVKAVLFGVNDATTTPIETILGDSRASEVIDARFIAAWELRLLGFTATSIAAILRRSHASILTNTPLTVALTANFASRPRTPKRA